MFLLGLFQVSFTNYDLRIAPHQPLGPLLVLIVNSHRHRGGHRGRCLRFPAFWGGREETEKLVTKKGEVWRRWEKIRSEVVKPVLLRPPLRPSIRTYFLCRFYFAVN